MTKQQALWASEHDWYLARIKRSANNYTVVVRADFGYGEYEFNDYQALREWAVTKHKIKMVG